MWSKTPKDVKSVLEVGSLFPIVASCSPFTLGRHGTTVTRCQISPTNEFQTSVILSAMTVLIT